MAAIKLFPAFRYFSVLLVISIPVAGISQDPDGVRYFGKAHFILEGTPIDESLKENRYDRLPISYKERVREPVWNLSNWAWQIQR